MVTLTGNAPPELMTWRRCSRSPCAPKTDTVSLPALTAIRVPVAGS
jgi:hypothetical protein